MVVGRDQPDEAEVVEGESEPGAEESEEESTDADEAE